MKCCSDGVCFYFLRPFMWNGKKLNFKAVTIVIKRPDLSSSTKHNPNDFERGCQVKRLKPAVSNSTELQTFNISVIAEDREIKSHLNRDQALQLIKRKSNFKKCQNPSPNHYFKSRAN